MTWLIVVALVAAAVTVVFATIGRDPYLMAWGCTFWISTNIYLAGGRR